MAKSELYEKGLAMRTQLLGKEYTDAMNTSTYEDPVMQKFRDLAAETVFGALWTRPGLDLKTRALICVITDAATGRDPELVLHVRMAFAPGLDRGRTHRGTVAYVGLRRRTVDSRSAIDCQQSLRGSARRGLTHRR